MKKKSYTRPVLNIKAYADFEKVYAGRYCTKEAFIPGCSYDYDDNVVNPASFLSPTPGGDDGSGLS